MLNSLIRSASQFSALKSIVASILLIIFSFSFPGGGETSWFIDKERFHISVHGQLSCQDCHSDITKKRDHPNPEDVNKTLNDFFRMEQCSDCHDEVLDEIEKGDHGGGKVANRQQLYFCLDCHNTHYQHSFSETAPKVDLSRPADLKCSLCHEFESELPELSSGDEPCMACHGLISSDSPKSIEATSRFCFYCHGTLGPGKATKTAVWYPQIDISGYASSTHSDVSCTVCHSQAAEFNHGKQKVGDCRQCHLRHDAKVANDVHLNVACGTCHIEEASPVKDPESDRILWRRDLRQDNPSEIHHMFKPEKEGSCRSCHSSSNTLGAAAMVLPAKSIICMPCHAATFSIGDKTSIIALIVFLIGMVGMGSIWFSGRPGGNETSGIGCKITRMIRAVPGKIFSPCIVAIVRSLILDGLLQRRLFRVSRPRWVLHALVFYPFVIRFFWGLVALTASLWYPQWPGAWVMLDKNHPLTAFLFDLTGVIVLFGIIGMIARRKQSRSAAGLPRVDWPAYSLLGGIMIVGFLLEGMRMAMTGSPGGAAYAFIGDAISRLMTGFDLTDGYGYVWYLHAILTGAFVAYLPFSRMLHMLIAPVSLAISATDRHWNKRTNSV